MLIREEDVVIRQAKLEDASEILHIQEEVVSEGDFLTTVSEEFNKTVEQQRDWIEKVLENDKDTMLVAEYQNTILGWIVFLSSNRIRLSHTGSIGMMVKKDFRSMGIGKFLMKRMLVWAEQNQSIEKVSLGVFSTNKKAIDLYKGMGFVEEGRKVKEFKFNENEYVDDILMYKFV
ncbi:N-acetyltransferase family protein [Alkalibacillus sp. S2W]|uniref:GNAT family N-acetyltransferase n=1 Tax=Alkalibacillus sp. S2W TaxID=3386553 RepID=UPI00398CA627